MPYGGGYSGLSSKNNQLNQSDFIKNSKRGAILIEFAFAVPVLFSLVYYIQDLARYKQIQQRMQFASHEIASNIQNIARQKGETLNSTDLVNAIRLANLSVFPGTAQYTKSYGWTHSELGYISVTRVHLVKGIDSNNAEIKWICRFHSLGTQYHLDIQTSEIRPQETEINTWKGKPENIHPDLRISENEVKIIIEHKFTTAEKDSRIFGFYLLKPIKPDFDNDKLFNSIVIFSPVSGAFDPNKPPE